MTDYLIALAAFCAIGLWVGLETWRMLRKKRARFALRVAHSPEEIRVMFRSALLSDQDVAFILDQIEIATELPKEKLAPQDRFAVELSPEKGWEFDDGLHLLPTLLHERFGGAATTYELNADTTIASLIAAIATDCAGRGRTVGE